MQCNIVNCCEKYRIKINVRYNVVSGKKMETSDMIIEIRAKNCYAFEDEIAFSLKAYIFHNSENYSCKY